MMNDIIGNSVEIGDKVAWGSRDGSSGAKTNIGEIIAFEQVPRYQSFDRRSAEIITVAKVRNLQTNKITRRYSNEMVCYQSGR